MKSFSIFLSLNLLLAVVALSSAAPHSQPHHAELLPVNAPLIKRDNNSESNDNSDDDGWTKGIAVASKPKLSQRDEGSAPPVVPETTTVDTPAPSAPDANSPKTQDNTPQTNPPQVNTPQPNLSQDKTPQTYPPQENQPQSSNPGLNAPNTPSLSTDTSNPLADDGADRKKAPAATKLPNKPGTSVTTEASSKNTTITTVKNESESNVKSTFYEADQLDNAACYGRNGLKPYNAKSTDLIAALPMSTLDMCYQCLEVRNNDSKKSIIVKIIDKCAGCAPGCIDLTPGAFAQLGQLKQGVLNIAWRAVKCPASGQWPNYENST
ncbi:5460_t:CDS:2 [Cetraspora pellucida]|uniref:5460_t:CDS:1 n=1 Tax=Cetraspora pellucida TaxID=1433469 RepID=A0A9N8WP41_9GLOM|nr:5460_t:CDS:2 [Cetraspora pellucida]